MKCVVAYDCEWHNGFPVETVHCFDKDGRWVNPDGTPLTADEIEWFMHTINDIWRWSKCVTCGKQPVEVKDEREVFGYALHDACIERLPGVMYACCGHGNKEPYLVLDGGSALYGDLYDDDALLYGDDALVKMRELGGTPPDWRGHSAGAVFNTMASRLAVAAADAIPPCPVHNLSAEYDCDEPGCAGRVAIDLLWRSHRMVAYVLRQIDEAIQEEMGPVVT